MRSTSSFAEILPDMDFTRKYQISGSMCYLQLDKQIETRFFHVDANFIITQRSQRDLDHDHDTTDT